MHICIVAIFFLLQVLDFWTQIPLSLFAPKSLWEIITFPSKTMDRIIQVRYFILGCQEQKCTGIGRVFFWAFSYGKQPKSAMIGLKPSFPCFQQKTPQRFTLGTNMSPPKVWLFEDFFQKKMWYVGYVCLFWRIDMNCWRIFCRRILLFVSGLEVEAKLQEQEECIDQRPYVAPKAHDQPRPILQMMLGSGKKTKDHLKPFFFGGGSNLIGTNLC